MLMGIAALNPSYPADKKNIREDRRDLAKDLKERREDRKELREEVREGDKAGAARERP
jgi:hypothetical protein